MTRAPGPRPIADRAASRWSATDVAAGLAAAMLVASCTSARPSASEFPIGKAYAWIATDSGSARHAPGDPSRYTIAFDASGRATIRLDCNRGSSTWTREGDRLSLAPVASTKMRCPEGSLDTAFAAGLAQVAAWRREGDDLVLVGRDGSAMRFRPLAR